MELLHENFITNEENSNLLFWIYEIENDFHKLEHNRKFIKFKNYNGKISDYVWFVKNRIIDVYSIPISKKTDKRENVFVNYLNKGSKVHLHRHYSPDNFIDLRANILLSGELNDGLPIVESRTLNVKEKTLWIFNSNKEHTSHELTGDKPRIALSFGFIVPDVFYENLMHSQIKFN